MLRRVGIRPALCSAAAVLVWLIAMTGEAFAEDEPALFFGQALPLPEDVTAYDERARALSERLMEELQEGGYVVSRWSDGSPEHVGDSLIWSGLAMAVLPCDAGRPILDAILRSLEERGGAFV